MKHIPNILTLLRCIATLCIIYFWIQGQHSYILPLLVFGLATDYFDGVIARKYNLSTKFGKQFDHYADKFIIISVFVIIALETFPYSSSYALRLLMCLVLLTVRDIYIGWFKTIYTSLPSLMLAKWKTTLQSGGLVCYFLGWKIVTLVLFGAATLASLVSGYMYWSLAKQGRGAVDAFKIKNVVKVLLGRKNAVALLSSFPSLEVFKKIAGSHITSVLVDLDGTIAPFDAPVQDAMLQVLERYTDAGIDVVIYSNTSDTSRLHALKEQGIQVYTGDIAKPYSGGSQDIATTFGIDLTKSVMIGDAPITDIPYDESLLAGTILVKPLYPTGGAKTWLHYRVNTLLQKFVGYDADKNTLE